MTNQAEFDRFYADNVGLIHSVARKGYARLQRIGAAIEYGDLVQDLSLTFMRAYELYDPGQGGAFSTYFMRAGFNTVNRIADRFEAERVELGIQSVEEMDEHAGVEGGSLYDTIDSGSLSPEEIVTRCRSVTTFLSGLSPLPLLIMQLVIDPPDLVTAELEAIAAHVEYARAQGFARRCKAELNVKFVCGLLHRAGVATHAALAAAHHEIKLEAERTLR